VNYLQIVISIAFLLWNLRFDLCRQNRFNF